MPKFTPIYCVSHATFPQSLSAFLESPGYFSDFGPPRLPQGSLLWVLEASAASFPLFLLSTRFSSAFNYSGSFRWEIFSCRPVTFLHIASHHQGSCGNSNFALIFTEFSSPSWLSKLSSTRSEHIRSQRGAARAKHRQRQCNVSQHRRT